MPHLWEVSHPYYGASDNETRFESFEELREAVDSLDGDMNHVYRFDWVRYEPEEWEREFYDTQPPEEYLLICFVMPRKERLGAWRCPISEKQETEVLEWLRGPRVLGSVRAWWAPLLDEVEVAR